MTFVVDLYLSIFGAQTARWAGQLATIFCGHFNVRTNFPTILQHGWHFILNLQVSRRCKIVIVGKARSALSKWIHTSGQSTARHSATANQRKRHMLTNIVGQNIHTFNVCEA